MTQTSIPQEKCGDLIYERIPYVSRRMTIVEIFYVNLLQGSVREKIKEGVKKQYLPREGCPDLRIFFF